MTSCLLCSPDFFRVDYVINPWMKPGTVHQSKALEQWKQLKAALEKNGIHVEVIEQEQAYPDMVFAADQAIVRGNRVLMSKFCPTQRQGETTHYAAWFSDHGYEVSHIQDVCFEGGECLRFGRDWFVGTGFRAEKGIIPTLESFLQASVFALELVDERYYHLDTCFFPVDAQTAFYYPPAFSDASRKFLLDHIPRLYEFRESDALGFSPNSIAIGDTVLIAAGNPHVVSLLEDLQKNVIEIDVSEFIKAGGGIHCLVLELA